MTTEPINAVPHAELRRDGKAKFTGTYLAMTAAINHIVTSDDTDAAGFRDFLGKCLARHHCGDWGDLCDDDKAANDAALTGGARILSAYTIPAPLNNAGCPDDKVWFITDASHDEYPDPAKRGITTILFPSEY